MKNAKKIVKECFSIMIDTRKNRGKGVSHESEYRHPAGRLHRPGNHRAGGQGA